MEENIIDLVELNYKVEWDFNTRIGRVYIESGVDILIVNMDIIEVFHSQCQEEEYKNTEDILNITKLDKVKGDDKQDAYLIEVYHPFKPMFIAESGCRGILGKGEKTDTLYSIDAWGASILIAEFESAMCDYLESYEQMEEEPVLELEDLNKEENPKIYNITLTKEQISFIEHNIEDYAMSHWEDDEYEEWRAIVSKIKEGKIAN